jgi:mRNA interferase MazF
MKRDYKNWHNKKSKIDKLEKRPFFYVREIWFCHLGANIGFEQDGNGEDFLRPVIVFKKFNNEIFWGIPLTKKRKNTKHYFIFSFPERGENTAILSQIRLIDARRLSYYIGEILEADFKFLIEKFKALLP